MILTTPDVNVVVIDFMTSKGNEMVSLNDDGSYTILINARLSYDGQLKAYEHAIKHINNNDFEKDSVQEIEFVAHDLSKKDSIPIPANQYLEHIKRLQAEQRKIKRQIELDKKRVKFIMDNCDMFKRAENHYLYGDDL